jgi:hypothetical protein
MVQVGMGEENMVDAADRVPAQGGQTGTRIHQDVVVYPVAGGMAAIADTAATTENLNPHRISP